MKLNPDIFKAYDIRGVYPDDIDEAGAKAIGTGFATYLGAREIAVGHDMRLSSPSLVAAFIEGVVEQGVNVSDYGLLSTDMMYFAVASGTTPAAFKVRQTARSSSSVRGGVRWCAANRRRL